MYRLCCTPAADAHPSAQDEEVILRSNELDQEIEISSSSEMSDGEETSLDQEAAATGPTPDSATLGKEGVTDGAAERR